MDWITVWFGSRHEMLSRVRGNYYILQNSWFGSIVAWIIVVWIKGWKSPRDDRFRCGLDQDMKCCQGLSGQMQLHAAGADQAGGLTCGTNWTIVNWTSTIWTMTFVQLIHVKFTYCSNDICSIDLCSVGSLFSCQIGQLAWWQKAIVQFDFCSIVFGQWEMFWWLC